jgi:hypothetical protein
MKLNGFGVNPSRYAFGNLAGGAEENPEYAT